ncbi:MAG: site-specific integrase [Bacteroidales bacterium]|nr:site-specific integrase [Bacteroidales bacterium]
MNLLNFEELSDRWKNDKKNYVRLSSYSTYYTLLESHLLPAFGASTEVREENVQEFILQKLRDGLSISTVKELVLVLKMILRYGASHGLCERPEWNLRYPSAIRSFSAPTLTKDDVVKMLDTIRANPCYKGLGIYICVVTGLRIGEVCALRWGDLDLDAGVLHVRRTLSRVYVSDAVLPYSKLSFGSPKTITSYRDIPLSDNLQRLVRYIMPGKDPGNYVLSDGPWPIEPRSYRNYFARFLKEVGIRRVRFHALRHFFATACIEYGADYKTVSTLLGHSDVRTTLNLYVHPNQESKRNCVNKLSTVLG